MTRPIKLIQKYNQVPWCRAIIDYCKYIKQDLIYKPFFTKFTP